MAIRAKVYTNRKSEKKIQVSGDVKELAAVVKGDDAATAEFNTAVTDALKAAKSGA